MPVIDEHTNQVEHNEAVIRHLTRHVGSLHLDHAVMNTERDAAMELARKYQADLSALILKFQEMSKRNELLAAELSKLQQGETANDNG